MGKSNFTYQRVGNAAVDLAMQQVSDAFARVDQATPMNVVRVNQSQYVAVGNEDVIVVNVSGRVTLPTPTQGWTVTIVQGARALTVSITTASASVAFDGDTPGVVTLSEPFASARVATDGAAYYVVGGSAAGPVIPPIPPFPPIVPPGPPFPPFPPLPPSEWLNGLVQYVSPTGDDINDGLGWPTAKATMFAAAAAITNHGGGTLYFAPNSLVGNPFPDQFGNRQGLVFRGDGLEETVPGWLPAVPFTLFGVGNVFNEDSFDFPGTTLFGADVANNFLTPILSGVGTSYPIRFVNMRTPGIEEGAPFGRKSNYRLGWDYIRNNDGTLQTLAISQAARSGSTAATGQTTFTISALPSALTVVSASRSGTTVTANIQLPSHLNYQQATTGCPIRIVTSDATFPSIDTVLTGQLDDAFPFDVPPGAIIRLQYTQAGAAVSTQPVTGGTYQTHGIQGKDQIAVLITSSTGGQFQTTCAMKVLSSTLFTVTVADVTGYSPRSLSVTQVAPANIVGSIVKQERGRLGMLGCYLERVTGSNGINTNGTADDPTYGPCIDIGSNTLPSYYLDYVHANGFVFSDAAADQSIVDPVRAECAIMCAAGAGGSSFSVEARHLKVLGGGIRAYMNGPQGQYLFNAYDVLSDTGGTFSLPTVDIVGGSGLATVNLDLIASADNPLPTPIVHIGPGFDYNTVRVGRLLGGAALPKIVNESPIIGPQEFADDWLGGGLPSPWQAQQYTQWAAGRITGVHPAAVRAMGTVGARYTNLFTAPSTWNSGPVFGGGGPVAGVSFSSVAAPDGSNTATRVTAAGASLFTCGATNASPNHASFTVGDYVVVGMWVNLISGPAQMLFRQTNTLQFVNSVQATPPTGAPGWQWVQFVSTVSVVGDGNFVLALNVPAGTTDFWGIVAQHIPVTLAPYDLYEYAGTLKHAPYYLQAGQTGTMDGEAFIAHGGIGVDTTVLTTPSGTASPTLNLPLLKADGTIQAYIPTIPTNSNLPTGTVTSVGATAPVTTTGGTTPVIGMPAATDSVDGYMTQTDHGELRKISVNGADTGFDYLAAKLVSQNGTITLTPISSNSLLSIDVASRERTLFYDLEAFNPILGFGYISTANNTTTNAGDTPYGLNVAGINARILWNITANTLVTSLGTGLMKLELFLNGGSSGYSVTALSTVSPGLITGSLYAGLGTTATTDYYSVRVSSTGTYVSGSISFTVTLIVGY